MRRAAGTFTALLGLTAAAVSAQVVLTPIGTYSTGIFNAGGAEIVAHDPASQRVFVVNAEANRLDVLDIRQPWAPRRVSTIDLAGQGGGVNSVAVRGGLVAAAVENANRQAPGRVAFFDADGTLLASVQVGALPDMLTFSPDGSFVLVANEGEPLDYCAPGLANDPEGSVSVIDLRGGVASLTQANVRTAGFAAFNNAVPAGVRVFGPGATAAQDFEPEYIAVSPDSRTAWVTLQENNALAIVDIASATVTAVVPLGTKDHSIPRNALDPSDRDGGAQIAPWPVRGLYQPDAIAAYPAGGERYLVLANEGDARDYDCFGEETRVGDLDLAPARFPDAAALQEDATLGRLRTTTASGDLDGDGRHDEIHTFGARSFSIRDAAGALVWDSGNELELIAAAALPDVFNSTNDENGSADSRSDDKGPEPEGVAVGAFRGRRYAFVGLERIGGVMVYDITNPRAPFFVQYVNPRRFDGDAEAGTAGDLGPEGLLYIPREQSPIARPLVVVGNEISGTVTLYSLRPKG
jgi:2',3'-cyclic-nucleotide 2'-phosphodiesterase/3'-nucleotidase/5'-nucleotidase